MKRLRPLLIGVAAGLLIAAAVVMIQSQNEPSPEEEAIHAAKTFLYRRLEAGRASVEKFERVEVVYYGEKVCVKGHYLTEWNRGRFTAHMTDLGTEYRLEMFDWYLSCPRG